MVMVIHVDVDGPTGTEVTTREEIVLVVDVEWLLIQFLLGVFSKQSMEKIL